uniref:Transposase n=1 Tax=Brugia timori TaxID=42155 RepID=A0A0R3R0A1_9BILA
MISVVVEGEHKTSKETIMATLKDLYGKLVFVRNQFF